MQWTQTYGPVSRLYLTLESGERIIVFVEHVYCIEQTSEGICSIRFRDGSSRTVRVNPDKLWELLNPTAEP